MNATGINANASVVRPSRKSLGLRQPQGYGLAVLSVGVAVGTLVLFERFGWRSPSGMVLVTVVAMNAWYGERGPAVLAIILAFVCMAYFFVEPHIPSRPPQAQRSPT